MYMLDITIYCFKKKSEINVCSSLNTYSFYTQKFNSLSDLIIASPTLEKRLKSSRIPIAFCISLIPGLMIGFPSTLSVPVTSAIISAFVSLPCDVLTSMSKSTYSSSEMSASISSANLSFVIEGSAPRV